MRVGYGLNVEQVQKLVMTPELRQAITILQLPAPELGHYIEQQLQENPFLEIREEEPELVSTAQETADRGEKKEYDIDWEDYFQDSSDLGFVQWEEEKQVFPFDNIASSPPSLADHLLFQLHLATGDERLRVIGEYLIGNIDEQGYLRVSLEEVASGVGASLDEVERALALIHTFDPPGVGARSLQECLLIQVEQAGIRDDLLVKVINNHLEDLAKGKVGRMSQVLGVSVQEIQRVADVIKTLEPKPGRMYGTTGTVRHIVPDVTLEKVGNDYVIIINDAFLPRLAVNSAYRSALSKESDLETRNFVENKLNAAVWLIRSIEQRRLTLYKVASCLVELQRDFLDYGVKYLKPLNLKKVAEMVGLHESTVSRATANKYVQTPQGVFEMKFFFSSGLAGEDGRKTSAESVKKMLEELIAGENPKNPLNDQQIAEYFQRQGVRISRRTVAKYRGELGIPPIRQRIRY
ncbi:MAG: RNA polymerase factor sigma-54 [Desulfotomaculales bacterium]